MDNLSDRVPIPPKDSMNTGLSPAKESTMLTKLGKPGKLTKNCSDPFQQFKKRLKFGVNVGPFKVSGLDFGVESLRQIFAEVQQQLPDVFAAVKSDGMLCVRHRRKSPVLFSNHSFGTAIDIFFGTEAVPQGVHLAHRGNALLFPFFNRHGWFWGAEFSGDFVDSMHFELAEETILKLPNEPL
jgi:D-alanyl-D-alanine carboxypeptidase